MFTQYFGLKFNPFGKEIDINEVYESADIKELSSRFKYIESSRGIFMIIGGLVQENLLHLENLFLLCYSSDVCILKSVIFYYTNRKNTSIKYLIIFEKTFKIKAA